MKGELWWNIILVVKGRHHANGPLRTYLEFSHFHFHCVGRYPCNFGHELVLTLLKSNVVTHTDYDAITRQFARDLGLQECVVCYQSIFNCIRTLDCNKMVPCSLHIGNSSRGVYGLDIVINQGSETYNETRQRSSQIRQFLVKVAISKVQSNSQCEGTASCKCIKTGGNFGAKRTHCCGFWLDVSFFSHVKKYRSWFWLDVSLFSRVKSIVRSSDCLELISVWIYVTAYIIIEHWNFLSSESEVQECVVCYQSIFNCIRTLDCNKMVPCSLHIWNSFRGVYGLDIVINQGSETYNETRQRSSQIRQFLVKVAISKVRLQLSHINFSQPLANLCQIRRFVKIVTFQEATFCHLI